MCKLLCPLVLLKFIQNIPSMRPGKKRLIIFLGPLGDFDSFEYVQYLVNKIKILREANIELSIIGIGTEETKAKFCKFIGISPDILEVVKDDLIHTQLELSNGIVFDLPQYIRLLLMCMGIGSPGTLREVIRGYIGDLRSSNIYEDDDYIDFKIIPRFNSVLFSNVFGQGFLRPFELASLRLTNMIEILGNRKIYFPNNEYLTRRGATFFLGEDNSIIYLYKPISLLLYAQNMRDPLDFIKHYL